MNRPSLGGQELEVWRYVAEHAPASTRRVVEHFAAEQGLARTTVLTVLERLRKKGYLTRARQEGVFHYSPQGQPGEVLQGLVRQFIEKTLAGSVSPLVAYLARAKRLSDEELADLQRLVEELKEERDRQKP